MQQLKVTTSKNVSTRRISFRNYFVLELYSANQYTPYEGSIPLASAS